MTSPESPCVIINTRIVGPAYMWSELGQQYNTVRHNTHNKIKSVFLDMNNDNFFGISDFF